MNVWPPVTPPGPENFQRAMVFIDGTNLFHRLEAERIALTQGALLRIAQFCVGERQLVRAYLYTSHPHHDKAIKVHQKGFGDGVRITFGDAIPTGDGNYREKGVDALLVADLVYHAAAKNYDFAALISVDQDFAQGLTRVEDFGCRTAVVAICSPVPQRLQRSADQVISIGAADLLTNGWQWQYGEVPSENRP